MELVLLFAIAIFAISYRSSHSASVSSTAKNITVGVKDLYEK